MAKLKPNPTQVHKTRHRHNTTIKTKYGTRQWHKFHHNNKQNRNDCQLITALNAYYYIYGKTIGQNTKTYEKLTDLAHTRHRAATTIYKVHQKLKLTTHYYNHLLGFSTKQKANKWLPIEAIIHHKHYGTHSILTIDYEPITHSYRILNANKLEQISTQGWILHENLQHYTTLNPNHKCKWKYRRYTKQ